MNESYLSVKNVSYIYPDGSLALNDVSFKINHQEKVALIGANGSGKSTLQFHLNGLFLPRRGQVTVGDLNVIARNFKQIRSQVGLVFQNPDDQLFMTTVWDDIAFGLKNLGVKEPELSDRIIQSLGAVQLDPTDYGHRNPDHLWGGKKKRVAIAGILALQPQILVLDEPSAQLDPASRRQLINLLARLPVTQLIATHDLDLVLDLCDRTLVLSKGELVYDGPTGRLMADQAFLESHALELPLSLRRPYCHIQDRPY